MRKNWWTGVNPHRHKIFSKDQEWQMWMFWVSHCQCCRGGLYGDEKMQKSQRGEMREAWRDSVTESVEKKEEVYESSSKVMNSNWLEIMEGLQVGNIEGGVKQGRWNWKVKDRAVFSENKVKWVAILVGRRADSRFKVALGGGMLVDQKRHQCVSKLNCRDGAEGLWGDKKGQPWIYIREKGGPEVRRMVTWQIHGERRVRCIVIWRRRNRSGEACYACCMPLMINIVLLCPRYHYCEPGWESQTITAD